MLNIDILCLFLITFNVMNLETLLYLNEYLTFYLIFPLLFLIGLYLTFKTKALPFLSLKKSFGLLLKNKQDQEGNISHYQAISGVLAGNFGTGNISGMAVALATGGPGALVWMWVMAFFGAIVQYGSCLLSIDYREFNSKGEYVGGPMYYLAKGVNSKKLAFSFAFVAIIASFTVGNFAQVNSVILPLRDLSLNPFLMSLILLVFVAIVILRGVTRFAQVASAIVPIMALFYLGAALIILFLHLQHLWPALVLMYKSSLGTSSVIGGILGFSLLEALSTGCGRGIFATDAGTGMAPIIQSSAKSSHPVEDGLVALVAPFLVMIVCTVTGLVLIVTDAWLIPGLESTNMCTYAFRKGLNWDKAQYIVIISLILFAYTTIIAWACCGARCVEYLWGIEKVKYFNYVYLLMIPVGALMNVRFAWIAADCSISLMMITNLIGVIILSRKIIDKTFQYFGLSISVEVNK